MKRATDFKPINKQKMNSNLLKLSCITILFCWVLKLFGNNSFVMPEYTYEINIWIRRLINFITYTINTLFFGNIIAKRKLSFKELLFPLTITCVLFFISLINELAPLKFVLEIISNILLSLYLYKKKDYKALLEGLFVSGIFILYQIVTLSYKQINLQINLDNFIVEKLLLIDYYILLLLTYNYSKEKGGYLYVQILQNIIHLGRRFRILVFLSKRNSNKECLSKDKKIVQEITSETGYKIFILILSISQFVIVGTLCHFINDAIIEFFIAFVSFVIMRACFGKSYHANKIITCTTLSIITFLILTRVSLPPYLSILCNILLGTLLAYMMYVYYYFNKYTTAQCITIRRGMSKEELTYLAVENNLTEEETNILIDFYCNKLKVVNIALKYGYSESNLYKIKADILKRISK